MKSEIITIGDELLLSLLINTNQASIAKKLLLSSKPISFTQAQ
jgi:molybdopterin-biosynthesis enzyme MoeA-like protein